MFLTQDTVDRVFVG